MDVLMKRGYESFVKLDSGGQANVYKSYKNNKLYAIKVVHVENPNNPKLDDDLKRELQIVRNLKHPNCIHVEELFRTKNKIYIIMDYMPNGTIGSVVRKNGPLCEWNAKLWFCPIARAIKYLHEHKIAHRFVFPFLFELIEILFFSSFEWITLIEISSWTIFCLMDI